MPAGPSSKAPLATKRDAADLLRIGFEQVGGWVIAGEGLDYRLVDTDADRMSAMLSVANALYAFCAGVEVLYIGKTTQTLKKRLQGYCKPGSTQSTNLKCHARIRAALDLGDKIDLLAFAPPEELQFRGLAINLAAGLEDVLIRSFAPPWNGSAKTIPVSESAEREAAQLAVEGSNGDDNGTEPELGRFTITLTPTYRMRGIINPGKAVSHLFGHTDAALTVRFSDGTPAVATRIDRRANRNGSVRLVGSNEAIATWFRRHFQSGDIVAARILSPYLIELLPPGEARIIRAEHLVRGPTPPRSKDNGV